ncbi:MAG: type II toxin-antitoxin system VapC family toxin [Lentisphaerae bacterium]|jgi:predicted nucleic acid-binding protein|nr:type II toxin-antitoxin system VapC family toxin [Lentisphaerota bacterium]
MKKVVGIDTCVVLRLLTGLPEDQADRARLFYSDCMQQGVGILVNDLIVAEVYHALIYFYDVPKAQALARLQAFLTTPGVLCRGHAPAVLATYDGKGAGLVDRLIRADLLKQTDRLVSFDKDFCRLPGVHAP